MKAFRPIISKLCALSTTPLFVNADAQVNYLNVDGDAVHFSIAEAKTLASPICVAIGANGRFTFSLKTDSGRAMYSLLITAMVAKQNLAVESAQDCADVAGVERADGISIAPTVIPANTTSGGGKQFYIYKSDGTTKLGTIISVETGNKTYYLDPFIPNYFKFFVIPYAEEKLLFTQENCQGNVQASNRFSSTSNAHFNNGKLMYFSGSVITADYLSNMDAAGNCVNAIETKINIEYLI